MIDYEGEQYQYPIMEDYSPSNQIMPHTWWGGLGSGSLISNSYSAVFASYNCSGFIVGRFDCSICTVPMRDPGLDRCSPSLLPLVTHVTLVTPPHHSSCCCCCWWTGLLQMIIWINHILFHFSFYSSANLLPSYNKPLLQNISSSFSNLRIKVQSRGPF